MLRLPHKSIRYAVLRQLLSRYRLPPGDWIKLDKVERSNRRFLLEHVTEVGSMFKAIAWDTFWVCVVGIPQCQRLLREHRDDLKPVTLELEMLFPKGFLRQMEAADHQHYRMALVRAILSSSKVDNGASWDEIATSGLSHYANLQQETEHSPETYIRSLDAIATGMLIQVFYGVSFNSIEYKELIRCYRKLGPYGLVCNIAEPQQQAFTEIHAFLVNLVKNKKCRNSIISYLHENDLLDDTMLGNLIYMVEMGRYDLYSLFRWISKYAANYPDLLKSASPSLIDAFVQETLRMDQSEALLRTAKRDIVFEGYLIPKHTKVRLCMWEAHKSAATFTDPLIFNPERFLNSNYAHDQYAPFGLDHHRCPFSDMVLEMSKTFLSVLVANYGVRAISDDMPVKGAYHWEPASRFSVELSSRNDKEQIA
jgi:cytochrome P450